MTEADVERLIQAAGYNRHATRDRSLVSLTYRHGLRSAEVTRLRWDAVDLDRREMQVSRVNRGKPGMQRIRARELTMLRRLEREQKPASFFVFTSERGRPFSSRGFRAIIQRLGVAAGLKFPVHPHMLRHACGHRLARAGHSTASVRDF